MSGLCKNLGIILRKTKLTLITGSLLLPELRQLSSDFCDPLIRNMDRRKIWIREIAVILCILLRTHCMRRLFIVIPSSGLLGNAFTHLQKLDLTLSFALNSMCYGLKRVQVLHLCSGSKCIASCHSHRKVHISTHGALLKLTIGNTQILHGTTKLLQISDNLICTSHIRLRNDLDQRNTASVVIYQRAVLPLIMDQLTCVLLHMHLMDPDFFLTSFCLDLHKSIMADWQIQLGNLVVLRIIRIKIVLTVKFAILIDAAVCGKSCAQGKFYHLFV